MRFNEVGGADLGGAKRTELENPIELKSELEKSNLEERVQRSEP